MLFLFTLLTQNWVLKPKPCGNCELYIWFAATVSSMQLSKSFFRIANCPYKPISRDARFFGLFVPRIPARGLARTQNVPSLPERDYVTFGKLLSQIRLSVCHPTQPVEIFGNVFRHFAKSCLSSNSFTFQLN